MKTRIILSPLVSNLDGQSLLDLIATAGYNPFSILHKGRNILWRAMCNNSNLVIKEFGNGTKSKFVYAIRKSKAARSMANALELIKRGIATPAPIAFAETRNLLGLLQHSWFISEYEESQSYIKAYHIYGHILTVAFADFVACLHEKGILHDDLNNTNVRVKISSSGEFHFSLIDLNRMRIFPLGKQIPLADCMKNVCRFCSIHDEFKIFARQYLRSRNLPDAMLAQMLTAKRRHDKKDNIRHYLKKIIRP